MNEFRQQTILGFFVSSFPLLRGTTDAGFPRGGHR